MGWLSRVLHDDDDEKVTDKYETNTGRNRYDRYEGNDEHHTHEWIDTMTGLQGGHGENLTEEERREHGRSLNRD